MSSISNVFKKNKALIAFITAGDPDLAATEKLIYILAASGADIIELGVPFSDSIADGPTIQSSYQRALRKNVDLKSILGLVKKVKTLKKLKRRKVVPIILMGSYNLFYKYGINKFAAEAAAAGVDGLIVPDLPPEDSRLLQSACKKCKMDTIFLVSPVSSPQRIKLAAKSSTGFIYLISLTGITGERRQLPKTLKDSVQRLRRITKKPIAVGFGISTPEQARSVAKLADGVIVGSAIVKLAHNKGIGAVGRFVKKLKENI
jgi:tryptophan synthase alpha chain